MVALFGGSFDPIHLGHLSLARELADRFSLTRVFFVPARQNPLKSTTPRASGAQRLEMVRLALTETKDPRFECLDWEVASPKPSYTLLTAERLIAAGHSSVGLILGDEVFRTLPHWHEPKKLLGLVDLLVATRQRGDDALVKVLHAVGIHDGKTSADGDRVEHSIRRFVQRVRLQALPFSSTTLRSELPGLDAAPPGLTRGVWDFIKENRLYSVS